MPRCVPHLAACFSLTFLSFQGAPSSLEKLDWDDGSAALVSTGGGGARNPDTDFYRMRDEFVRASRKKAMRHCPMSVIVKFREGSTEAERRAARAAVKGKILTRYGLVKGMGHPSAGASI